MSKSYNEWIKPIFRNILEATQETQDFLECLNCFWRRNRDIY
jgi:hypothetical protein